MVAPSELIEQQRDQAQRRFEVLRPHIQDGVALAQAAAAAAIPAGCPHRRRPTRPHRVVLGARRTLRRNHAQHDQRLALSANDTSKFDRKTA
jgi:hypothetical protein